MLAALVALVRPLGLLSPGHRAVALENVVLRHQLSTVARRTRRSDLNDESEYPETLSLGSCS